MGPNSMCLQVFAPGDSRELFSLSAFQVSHFAQLHLCMIMFPLSHLGFQVAPSLYLSSHLLLHHCETTVFPTWLDPCIEISKNMFYA